MNSENSHRLTLLLEKGDQNLLKSGLKGLEKESLRIDPKGLIAQTPHPVNLGAALTHPHITTDYSEALLEFITPPFTDIKDTLQFLDDIHRYVYDHIGSELLWSSSMPCGINGDTSIPIAEYGHSNVGQMKHIYRKGLSYRYGRTMQSIAGVHFNYSVPEALWPILMALEKKQGSLQDYISESYFGLIRNFLRQGWLILYLFGASPAICKSFFKSRPHLIERFDRFDDYTLYHPYATSLRMSDIGYKSENQANLDVNYNSLSGYISSLCQAITTPYPEYQKMGIVVDDEYRQLNGNILQIENEFYSVIRPKQIAKSCEKPTHALQERGVKYIEIRSLDLDLFAPNGIDESRARFLEAFALTCLFQDSPPNQPEDRKFNNQNQLAVANQGRKPDLMLQQGKNQITLKQWGQQILETMQPICAILDQDNAQKPYNQSLEQQKKLLNDPDLTPSARILQGMSNHHQPFSPFAMTISKQHQAFFKNKPVNAGLEAKFKVFAEQSFIKQKTIENNDSDSFPEFLDCYFSQKQPVNC